MGFLDNVNFLDPAVPHSPIGEPRPASHPQSAQKAAASDYIYQARYQMFDLLKDDQVAKLEEIMSSVMLGERVIRQEKWSHDKDGCTTVTLSWFDLIPRKRPKSKSDDPGPVGLADGTYPGSGGDSPENAERLVEEVEDDEAGREDEE